MSEPVEEPAPNTKKRGRPRRGFGMKGAAANSVDTDKYAGPKRARAGPRPSRERSEQLANGARSTETAENMDRLTKMTKVLKNPAGNCRSFRENCSLLMSLVALLSMVFGGQGTGNSDYECKGFYTGGNPSFNKCVAHTHYNSVRDVFLLFFLIDKDEHLVLKACREAGIAPTYDHLRKQAVGRHVQRSRIIRHLWTILF